MGITLTGRQERLPWGCPLRNAFLLKPPGALVTHNGSATRSLCPPSAYPKQCMGDAYTKNYLLLI